MTTSNPKDWNALREQMIREQLYDRQVTNPRVLEAIRAVPRHLFVPEQLQESAYDDGPLPIGLQQTISQPYIVGYMSQCLALTGSEIVLEIGTGSGYQTAVLSRLVKFVYSMERHPELAEQARARLRDFGATNVEIRVGDGSEGLPDRAPFEAILITAAAPAMPQVLRYQLSEAGGRLVLPVGNVQSQYLERITRHGKNWIIEQLMPVSFVLLIGKYGFSQGNPTR